MGSADLTLAIDSSGQALYLGLRNAKGEIHLDQELRPYNHDEALASLVERLLKSAGCAAHDVRKILVGSGPGSFTGLRIGWGFAFGWALARQVQLQALCSFRAIAATFAADTSADAPPTTLVVLDDAGRGDCFCAAYQLQSDRGIEPLFEPALMNSSEMERRVLSSAAKMGTLSVVCRRKLSLPQGFESAQILAEPQLAKGLLQLDIGGRMQQVIEPQQLALLRPNYLRQVAAKTIIERSLAACAEH